MLVRTRRYSLVNGQLNYFVDSIVRDGTASESATWTTLLEQGCDVQRFAPSVSHSVIKNRHSNVNNLNAIL